MGLFSKIFGRASDAPMAVHGNVVTIRRAEIAAHLERPQVANFAIEEMKEPCDRCGGTLLDAFITTGGEHGDMVVWRDHPIAVDGWACVPCGVFRYPKKMDPARIHELNEEGASRGRAGQLAAAEQSFARIVWNWPGYFLGHINYAEATRSRLHAGNLDDAAVERRLIARMVEQYEAAIEAYREQPNPSLVSACARAHLGVARAAIEAGANERAMRFLDACLGLEGLTQDDVADAGHLRTYVAEGRSRFDRAQRVLGPYLRLQGRPPKTIDTGDERKNVTMATELLDALVRDAPDYWQAAWLLAKAKEALGDLDGAISGLRAAHAAHPTVEAIAKDFSMLLLGCDEIAEACTVNQTICTAEPNATNLCNLAVTQLLSGNLDAADDAISRSLALDPNDGIAQVVKSRIAKYRAGATLPRTIRDLERG